MSDSSFLYETSLSAISREAKSCLGFGVSPFYSMFGKKPSSGAPDGRTGSVVEWPSFFPPSLLVKDFLCFLVDTLCLYGSNLSSALNDVSFSSRPSDLSIDLLTE